ncbi:MAG: Bcr/CflA family efflux MFS transporter [Aquiluna sp.]
MTKLIYALLVLVTILVPFQFDVYVPAFPQLAQYFSASEAEVQLTLTATLMGMASAQLLIGSLSDVLGRRRPLIFMLVLYVVSSAACLFAPSIEVMTLFRFILGFAASSGFVLVNAYIRDVSTNEEAPRRFATLITINGIGPLLAPLVGGQLLRFGDWKIVFIFLAILGAISLSMIAFNLPESLPVERRGQLRLDYIKTNFRALVADRNFLISGLAWGLTFGTAATYISGSPFAIQEHFGLTETEYTYMFAFSNLLLLFANFTNRHFLKSRPPIFMLRYGMSQGLVAATVLMILANTADPGFLFVVGAFGLSISTMGFTGANATALALANHKDRAGLAAGIFGFFAFGFAALSAPLSGLVFGASLNGLLLLMSMFLISAATTVFLGLRKLSAKSVVAD